MSETTWTTLSPADLVRRRDLRRMKAIALGALLFLAVLFVIGFIGEQRLDWMSYLRAAAEGGMVGALADWFAVTALFRRPLGLPIPHTAIIPTRKDEIGATLGEFVETNFLSTEVVHERLSSAEVTARLSSWLARPGSAERVADEAARLGATVLRALSDDDVQDVIASLTHEHLISPDWSDPAGTWLTRIVDSGAHHTAVDLAADTIAGWLANNRDSFTGLLSGRLPGWVPSLAHRFVDDAAYREAVAFVEAVRADPRHPARGAIDAYLARLAEQLLTDPTTRAKLEGAKEALFDSPRVKALAAQAWNAAKEGLTVALGNPESSLRRRLVAAIADIGTRLGTDADLRARADGWIIETASALVGRYRHDIASIITDTVRRWEAKETSAKIELMVGKDLQYIRLNGTVIGALAGLAIHAIAHAALTLA